MADTTQAHGVHSGQGQHADGMSRRDFIYLTAGAAGAVAVGSVAWPFIHSMNPAADTLALASIEVDVAPIKEGQAVTVTWRGKPVFIRNRTQAEIDEARKVNLGELRDPAPDESRVRDKPQWLVLVGVCTHLGCVPLGQKTTENRGEFGGYFCPCHGSHYDTSGRIRKGPAPTNLEVPPYQFAGDTVIKIG
ncbi:MAG TPA: ubiquinol-cytochrome c reductase iron-sulfur subunit [Alphaproteobacteria bacterium]|nr:ubiquinol-cytochrome c reductase iron-sulfur subunit [Alphaproteobacteria bacterium]